MRRKHSLFLFSSRARHEDRKVEERGGAGEGTWCTWFCASLTDDCDSWSTFKMLPRKAWSGCHSAMAKSGHCMHASSGMGIGEGADGDDENENTEPELSPLYIRHSN